MGVINAHTSESAWYVGINARSAKNNMLYFGSASRVKPTT